MIFGQTYTVVDDACVGADVQGTLDDMGSLVNAGMLLASAIERYGSNGVRQIGATYFHALKYEWAPYDSLPPSYRAGDAMSPQAIKNICEVLTALNTLGSSETDPDIAEAHLFLRAESEQILVKYVPGFEPTVPVDVSPPGPPAPSPAPRVRWSAIGIGAGLLFVGLLGYYVIRKA